MGLRRIRQLRPQQQHPKMMMTTTMTTKRMVTRSIQAKAPSEIHSGVSSSSSGVEKRCHTRVAAATAADSDGSSKSKRSKVELAAADGPAAEAMSMSMAMATTTTQPVEADCGSSSSSSSSSGARGSSSSGGQMLGPNSLGEMDPIKLDWRAHPWHWNNSDKSYECVVSDDKLEVCFHPECSESAAAIRGSEPLVRNGNYYFWEVTALDKTYGTSIMFGLCTKDQKLHANEYCNLVGLDRNGWSLSHKGLIWHNGLFTQYTEAFPPNKAVRVGLLFNTMRGELSYFVDGENLGVAFYGLNNVDSELYPVIGSTAKNTRIRLTGSYRGLISLLDRSCFLLAKNSQNRIELMKRLHQHRVPSNLIRYLVEVCGGQTEKTAQPDQYNWNVNNLT